MRRTSRERRGLPPVADGPVRIWVQRFLTFQFVCLGWVFFNASGVSQALAVLGRVFSGWGEPSPLVTPLLVLVVVGHPALPVRAAHQRVAAPGGVLAPARGVCRSGSSASRCSASPRSAPSASRPSSTTGSDDMDTDLPTPSSAGAPSAEPEDQPAAVGSRTGTPAGRATAGCACPGPASCCSACWPSRCGSCCSRRRSQHNAQVSPVGTRRTISLDITRPIAALSRALQLSRIVSATGRENDQPGGTAGLIISGPTGDTPGRSRDAAARRSEAGAAVTDDDHHGPAQPQAPDRGRHRCAC